MRHVMENKNGIAKSWTQEEEVGVLENLEKSGAFTIKVAKLAKQPMSDLMKTQEKADP